MPTGTLANHMAVRALAGGPSRVIVQSESHLYQDEGDCAQTLSGLTLVPLAAGWRNVLGRRCAARPRSGRRAHAWCGASPSSPIETPVRRKQGARFDAAELQKIVAIARREGIRMHPRRRAAVPAGGVYRRKRRRDRSPVRHGVCLALQCISTRRTARFWPARAAFSKACITSGGCSAADLNHAWPFAAVALHYLPGFGDRFSRGREDIRRSDPRASDVTTVSRSARIPSGTNLFRLRVRAGDAVAMQKRLAAKGVLLGAPDRDTFLVGVNETLNRMSSAELTDALVRAVSAG